MFPTPTLMRGYRSRARRVHPVRLVRATRSYRHEEFLWVDWINRGLQERNWGDAIAPFLAAALSGRRVVNARDHVNLHKHTVYTTVGSMLGSIAKSDFEVWGTGFVDSRSRLKGTPAVIHATRGPLTQESLEAQGIRCPSIFGDPVLLMPLLYTPPAAEQRHELGFIPHFREKHLPQVRSLSNQGVKIIDIEGDRFGLIDAITSCDRIASSSLHGLVAADAYGVPAAWVRLSDLPAGDGFKFRDHLAAGAGRDLEALIIDARTSPSEILDRIDSQATPQYDTIKLLKACPFATSAEILLAKGTRS